MRATVIGWSDRGNGLQPEIAPDSSPAGYFWMEGLRLLSTVGSPPLPSEGSGPRWMLLAAQVRRQSHWCFVVRTPPSPYDVATVQLAFAPPDVSPAVMWECAASRVDGRTGLLPWEGFDVDEVSAELARLDAGSGGTATVNDPVIRAGVEATLGGLVAGVPRLAVEGPLRTVATIIGRVLLAVPTPVAAERTWATCLAKPPETADTMLVSGRRPDPPTAGPGGTGRRPAPPPAALQAIESVLTPPDDVRLRLDRLQRTAFDVLVTQVLAGGDPLGSDRRRLTRSVREILVEPQEVPAPAVADNDDVVAFLADPDRWRQLDAHAADVERFARRVPKAALEWLLPTQGHAGHTPPAALEQMLFQAVFETAPELLTPYLPTRQRRRTWKTRKLARLIKEHLQPAQVRRWLLGPGGPYADPAAREEAVAFLRDTGMTLTSEVDVQGLAGQLRRRRRLTRNVRTALATADVPETAVVRVAASLGSDLTAELTVELLGVLDGISDDGLQVAAAEVVPAFLRDGPVPLTRLLELLRQLPGSESAALTDTVLDVGVGLVSSGPAESSLSDADVATLLAAVADVTVAEGPAWCPTLLHLAAQRLREA